MKPSRLAVDTNVLLDIAGEVDDGWSGFVHAGILSEAAPN
jgi:hypothetical protein